MAGQTKRCEHEGGCRAVGKVVAADDRVVVDQEWVLGGKTGERW